MLGYILPDDFPTLSSVFGLGSSFPVVRQRDRRDCGPACLTMVAQHYGRTLPLQYIRETCRTTRQGSSIQGLVDGAEEIGFRTLAAKLTFEKLRDEAPLPCIVHWQNDHFVVLTDVKGDTVHVVDPAAGRLTYSVEEFVQRWAVSAEPWGSNAPTEPRGIAVVVEPSPKFWDRDVGGEYEMKSKFDLIWGYARRHTKEFRQVGYGVLAATAIQLALPYLMQAVVDVGIANRSLNFIYVILAAQLALILGRTTIEFIQRWLLLYIGQRTNIMMTSDFLRKLMRLPLSFYDSKNPGDLFQRVDDHQRIKQFMTQHVMTTLSGLLTLSVFGLVLLFYSWKIFAVFLVGSLAYLGYVVVFLEKRREIDYKRFSELSESQDLMIEAVHGMEEIKIHGAEQRSLREWERVQAKLFRTGIASLKIEQWQRGGAKMINETKNVVITILGAMLVIDGNLTFGALLAIQYIIGQLNGPLDSLLVTSLAGQDAKISLDRLNEVHSNPEEEQERQLTTSLTGRSIRVKDVSFGYAGFSNERVLDGLSLEIPEGKVTAIVGPSGCGKTTLLKLLLKFYDPDEGAIYLDDVNLQHVSHATWRQQCGVVMQDGVIFTDSIAQNIALGEDVIDEERLLRAARVASIQSFVNGLPHGFFTVVGRGGKDLSRGQKQRLLIARAVYKDPNYLLFDEATSALDAETESSIVDSLDDFFRDRTVVVVAHRLSTVRDADQIVVLGRGGLVESGTHEELIASSGAYYRLVEHQLGP